MQPRVGLGTRAKALLNITNAVHTPFSPPLSLSLSLSPRLARSVFRGRGVNTFWLERVPAANLTAEKPVRATSSLIIDRTAS